MLQFVVGLGIDLVHFLFLRIGHVIDAVFKSGDVLEHPPRKSLVLVLREDGSNALFELILDVFEVLVEGIEVLNFDMVTHFVEDLEQRVDSLVGGLLDDSLLAVIAVGVVDVELLGGALLLGNLGLGLFFLRRALVFTGGALLDLLSKKL